MEKLCEHPIDKNNPPTLCGKPATCAIKTHEGKLVLQDTEQDGIARGVGSLWQPICALHRDNYPDHEGFEL